MKQAHQSLTQALSQLRHDLGAPHPLEQAVLNQAIAVLEACTAHPTTPPELELLYTQLLAGVRQLQSDPDNKPERLAALAAALNATEKFLSDAQDSPAHLAQSTQALTQLLDQTEMASQAACPAPAVAREEEEMLANLINEFLVESYENLDQLDRDLVTLEQDPSAKSTLASIFRTIHTIKGTCGFFGFGKLEAVTHVGENLLSRLRDGKLKLTAARTTGLLALVDAVRQMLNNIESTQVEGAADYAPLIARLTALNQDESAPLPVEVNLQSQPAIPTAAPAVESTDARNGENRGGVEPELLLSSESAPLVMLGQPAAQASSNETASAAPQAKPATALNTVKAEATTPTATAAHSVTDNNIRVDVGLLDVLMNLVGELVLARNQLLQYTATQADQSFVTTTQRLNVITTELQAGVMKTRLQPIGNIWNKFPRIVRDLAVACGKKITLELMGQETEMDKTIIEAIKDPLTHLLRNAADHGIEMPAARLQNGKPAEGHIYLRAYHEGGQVNIEISDDGAGIDPVKLKQRAQERGLITGEQAARMSEREALNLIFLPGFSTAEKVTNISGRGVGMDVVRTNIEKIGGTLDVQSQPGAGSTIKLRIPLTLAIIPALLVTSGGDRFAIPQVSLLELVRLESEQARTSIESIHGTPVYRLRGKLLPLVYLNQELRLKRLAAAPSADEAVNIVVLRAEEHPFGLVVDAINDTEEIVVKPLGKQLKGLTTFAGATILGDGKVALILDVTGLAQQAGVVATARDRTIPETMGQTHDKTEERQSLLLFRLGSQGRMAVPLAQVARLEEISASSIERAGRQEVLQYRGQIMPLLRLSQLFNYDNEAVTEPDLLPVVVCSGQTRSIGLVVDQIVDIAEETVTKQHHSQRAGVLGTAIIQQRVTELLDVPTLIQTYAPDWGEQNCSRSAPLSDGCQNIDSPGTVMRKASLVAPTVLTPSGQVAGLQAVL